EADRMTGGGSLGASRGRMASAVLCMSMMNDIMTSCHRIARCAALQALLNIAVHSVSSPFNVAISLQFGDELLRCI
ncbi:MAG TPA: hypothetical protein VK141_10075, partial [Nitrosomonas sp.]|nr:hypothetical protein [Nitrosomonas sp.]